MAQLIQEILAKALVGGFILLGCVLFVIIIFMEGD